MVGCVDSGSESILNSMRFFERGIALHGLVQAQPKGSEAKAYDVELQQGHFSGGPL